MTTTSPATRIQATLHVGAKDTKGGGLDRTDHSALRRQQIFGVAAYLTSPVSVQ